MRICYKNILNHKDFLVRTGSRLHSLLGITYVTGPGKTGLIYTKYTCSCNSTYLLFCICYPKSVRFTELLMDLCIYNDILDAIRIADKKLLHFKLSKSGQILHVDKTSFPRPGHIFKQQTITYIHFSITLAFLIAQLKSFIYTAKSFGFINFMICKSL